MRVCLGFEILPDVELIEECTTTAAIAAPKNYKDPKKIESYKEDAIKALKEDAVDHPVAGIIHTIAIATSEPGPIPSLDIYTDMGVAAAKLNNICGLDHDTEIDYNFRVTLVGDRISTRMKQFAIQAAQAGTPLNSMIWAGGDRANHVKLLDLQSSLLQASKMTLDDLMRVLGIGQEFDMKFAGATAESQTALLSCMCNKLGICKEES